MFHASMLISFFFLVFFLFFQSIKRTYIHFKDSFQYCSDTHTQRGLIYLKLNLMLSNKFHIIYTL